MAATDRINSLREEQEQLRQQNESILQSSQKKEEVSGPHFGNDKECEKGNTSLKSACFGF